MATILAFVIGGLYAAGLYLMLRRSIMKLIFGLVLLGHGTNLLIFTMGGLTRAYPPLIPEGAANPTGPFANPLPQALILTAIVVQAVKTDDLDDMKSTDHD